MSIQIKNRWNGSVIHTVNADTLSGANLSGANLSGANLRSADLRSANLRSADLRSADLSGANLRSANLSGANLSGANLRSADLRSADLRSANLSGANLSGADLRSADLRSADLRSANLRSADLRSADLSGANLDNVDLSWYQFIPETGSFEAWKKCKNGVIVKLLIPASAKRSHGTERKCRATHAKVLHVYGAIEGISQHDGITVYRKGETVKADSFDADRWNTCGHGIHFFITRKEAELY